MSIKKFEAYSDYQSETIEDILLRYDFPDIEIPNLSEINSIKDVYNTIRKIPNKLFEWLNKIYSENKEAVDKEAQKLQNGLLTEEICPLTLISIAILAYIAYKVYMDRQIGKGNRYNRGSSNTPTARYSNKVPDRFTKSKSKGGYSQLSQTQLKSMMDKALDKSDYEEAEKIGKYLK